MPITVNVYLKPANAPSGDIGTEVGTFAAVRNGGKIDWPSGRLVFDITSAARRLGGQEVTVELFRTASAARAIRTIRRSNMKKWKSRPSSLKRIGRL